MDDLLELDGHVLLGTGGRHLMLEVLNRLNSGTKDEDVLVAYLLVDLDVGSVHCAEDQSSIHDELHVAGS